MANSAWYALALLTLCAGTAFAQFERPQKKLIQYGWGVPYPDFVRANIRQMEEKTPFFDGLVIRTKGGWSAYPAHVFRKTPVPENEYDADIADLRATPFNRFRENFLLMWGTCEEGWDWFNEQHWHSVEQNTRLLARVAKAGGCVGVCFDPEPYGGNPWHYPDQPDAKNRSFAEYWARVRQCGAGFMKAIQSEFPNARILTFFWGSLFGDIVDIPDPQQRMERLSRHGYGLLPAFLNGMLDAMNDQIVLIDGNESAYYYRQPEQYPGAFHLMKQRALALIAPENRRNYALQVQAGFALYPDLYCGLVPTQYAWGRIGHYLTPEERARWLEHNAYHALRTTDEYVWCYSERMDWWGTQQGAEWHNFVPPGAAEALQSVRAKVERGQPLGFSIREMLESAQQRQQSELREKMIRREATVFRLKRGQRSPRIDGRLDDRVWQQMQPPEPFVRSFGGEMKPVAGTQAWVTWDDRYLYIAFRCEEPSPQQMVIAGSRRDDEVWQGDCVEVFISRSDAPIPYWHFILNPRGVQWDGASDDSGGDNVAYDARWRSVVFVGEKEWTAEIAIPWNAIGGKPQPGEKRCANLCRQRRVGDTEWSSWSQVAGGFLEPENFGTWIFSE